MDAGVQIRTIEPGDRAAVLDLYRKHYWRSHCLFLNPDFFHWQFDLPPGNAPLGGDQSVVAVDRHGQLLAHYGLAATDCSLRGKPLRGGNMLSWLTIPEARGRGLGHRLLGWVIERHDFLFSRSPLPTSLPIFRRLGFRYFQQCRRWIAVLDAPATLALAVDASDAAARRAEARAVRCPTSESFSVGREVPPGASALARMVLADSMTFDRTDAYLRWRYEQHPCLRYEFIWLGAAAAPDCVAVVRVENVTGRPGRVLRVVEFLSSRTHAVSLANAVFAFGKQQGCAFADAFGVSERFLAGFVAAGGFDTIEEPELRLPHLFQPWTAQVETPGLLIYGRRTGEGEGRLGGADDTSLIHLTKGDNSLDWPSWDPAAGRQAFAPAIAGNGAVAA